MGCVTLHNVFIAGFLLSLRIQFKSVLITSVNKSPGGIQVLRFPTVLSAAVLTPGR